MNENILHNLKFSISSISFFFNYKVLWYVSVQDPLILSYILKLRKITQASSNPIKVGNSWNHNTLELDPFPSLQASTKPMFSNPVTRETGFSTFTILKTVHFFFHQLEHGGRNSVISSILTLDNDNLFSLYFFTL